MYESHCSLIAPQNTMDRFHSQNYALDQSLFIKIPRNKAMANIDIF